MTEDIIMAIIRGVVAISFTTVRPLCLAYMKRAELMKTQQQLPVPDIIARLERMEAGIESMSAEIERIGEGQRFTTRLLNERDQRALNSVNTGTRSD